VECLFCRIVAGTVPGRTVLDTRDVLAFLDTRPVFKGHTLVVPKEHADNLADVEEQALTAVFTAARRVSAAMQEALGAQGSFVALNNVVSQSVPHLHVHVVPRTKGDGLRGFFWPRTTYADDAEAAAYAARLTTALR
jgi:histidine triad (HIT) family protein